MDGNCMKPRNRWMERVRQVALERKRRNHYCLRYYHKHFKEVDLF
ncbi:MAG: hypothetical protein ACFFCS_16205 [Candidatus Hodarchaeota archaeon]